MNKKTTGAGVGVTFGMLLQLAFIALVALVILIILGDADDE